MAEIHLDYESWEPQNNIDIECGDDNTKRDIEKSVFSVKNSKSET